MIAAAAGFSDCRRYRYTLNRLVPVTFRFEPRAFTGDLVQFIGLNPSTADEVLNDPTIRKCIGFASRLGFARMCMTNLFAWRSTDPLRMLEAVEPVGADNLQHIIDVAARASLIIVCWGVRGGHLGQDSVVLDALGRVGKRVHCLRITKGGFPEHPLYIPYSAQPEPYWKTP